MVVIQGIVVDDIESNATAVIERLDLEFGKIGWKVQWTIETKPNAAIHLIEERPAFHLVVADILYRREDLPGEKDEARYDIIESARERSKDTYILAVSSGDDSRRNLMSEARRYGATRTLLRNQFSRESDEDNPRAIVRGIRDALVVAGVVRTLPVTPDPARHPGVEVLLQEVGSPTISELYRRVLGLEDWGHRGAIRVGHLVRGASGARVCRVSTELPGVGVVHHVLKLGHDRALLQREAIRGANAARLLSQRFFVRHETTEPVGPVNGWWAIASLLVGEAIDFRTWIAGSPSQESVEMVLSGLLVDGLGQLYSANQQPTEDLALESLRFPGYRCLLVVAALDYLAPAISRIKPFGGAIECQKAVRTLISFCEEGILCGLTPRRSTPGNWRCLSHGDLHGGNVLVYRGNTPTPTLIDASEFGHAHWATDPARLHVDLILRCAGKPEDSMFWDEFPAWRDRAETAAVDADDATPDTGSAADIAAFGAHWISRNLARFALPATLSQDRREYAWQWHAALAAQYLRGTYQKDLPAPKRLLAAVAAHDQLRRARAMVTG